MFDMLFEQAVPNLAYEVRLRADGRRLEWTELTPSGRKRYTAEPTGKPLRRAMIGVLSLLPIEWLL